MDQETLKVIAAQLRKPHGAFAKHVAQQMNQGNKAINEFAIAELNLFPKAHILEIGMGNGFFVKDILTRDKSVKYIGCDYSPEMVEEATMRNERFIKSGQAQFFCTRGEKLPFDDETFDTVFSVNTIYFWDNPTLILSEIKRVLKPKGELLVALRPKSVMEYYPFTQYGFRLFSKEDVSELLTENDFQITSVLEEDEPKQDINGEMMEVEALIVCAGK